MASKVMVKLPVAPFGQVNKSKNNEVVISTPKVLKYDDAKTPEQVRLEQNIRFLQDQHQQMLAGLQGEVEKLKAKNRELQFQLIFGKGQLPSSSSSPSSPEEEGVKHRIYASPKILTNTTPLQVEILEKEMGELKIQMQELESRNVYLSAIVDEQKKQLERYDRRREKEQRAGPGDAEVELLRKLDDAETLIRRLRRENSDLRRENTSMIEPPAQNVAHHSRDNGYQSPRGQNHRGRGYRSGYNQRGGWFPPLHTQSFWQGGRIPHDRAQQEHLPDIPLKDGPSSSQYHVHSRKGNNNHYHGDGRKYRGGHHKGNKPS